MSNHVLLKGAGLAVAAAVVLSAAGAVSAQIAEQRLHLNPVIAKLAEGRTVYGLQAGIEMSIGSARAAARAPADYIYVDMEHNPLDMPALYQFHLAMADRAMVLKKGNLQPNVALMARFPPEADESGWVVKQALDMGLHGVFFNGVDTPEQAKLAVSYMRYPPRRDSKYPQPQGVRGSGPGNATWLWGLTTEEYERHADLWPLNPDGDLLATMMIESVEGLANVDQIAATPGVGSLFLGNANDLAHSMGLPGSHPEVEMARQKILTACKAHKIACNITANDADDIVRRVNEGWHMIRTTVPAINAARPRLKDPKVAPPPADAFALPR
jgi:4-hydroxy-2-oxoheptanedioate aldolase